MEHFSLIPDPRKNIHLIEHQFFDIIFIAKDGKAPIHVVSAWLAENRVVPAQRKVDDKSNEITAIPELPALLDIQGMTVTIDAIGCQAVNLLNGYTHTKKCGVKAKRLLASADCGIRERILKI